MISALARSYVRSRATEIMSYTCRIERVLRPDTYDENLVYLVSERTTIYEGPCRLWEVTAPSTVVLGDIDYYQQTTQLSIPWDTEVEVRRYDQIEILTAPDDDQLLGRRFEVQTVAKGGELRATRRFTVTGVEGK